MHPAQSKQKRQNPPLSSSVDNGKLKWQTWNGFLPDRSVSIYNNYVERIDYICKYKCNSGFYNPNAGSYCHYPYGDKEYRVSQFEILVNDDNFEMVGWKEGSYGSVPPNSVRTCSSDEIYVGKNKYGLGKVHPKHTAFFLPWKGKEYWYKSYEVLTIDRDIKSEHISNVNYKINEAKILKYPPETMRISSITNSECNTVLKTVTLSKTSRVDKRWDVGSSFMFGLKKTFTGGVPGIASGSVEVSAELSFQFSGGHTYSEESTHSVSVEVKVPPNHYCRVYMVGYYYKANIPFTAHLSRTYSSGQTTRTLIAGTYDRQEMGDIRAVIDRCRPLTDAEPCTSK